MTFFRRIRLSFRLTIGNRAGEGTRPIGAIIGIAIAIMPLIVVVHVSDAMISGIAERFIETGTYHMRARPQLSMNESDLAADVRRVQAIDGVEYATIERNGFGLVYSNALRSGVQIRAVDPHIYQNDPVFSSYLSVGQGEFSISDPNDIVIGRSIADNLQLNVGDTLRVLTVRSLPGGGVIPRVSPFTVRGIVSTGYQELDRLWVFMNSKRGDRILPPEDSSVSIGIKVEHPFALPNDLFRQPDTRVEETRTTSREIQDTLGSGYRIRTWFEEEQSRYLSFGTTRNALVVVMVLIMAVATVNISSSMVLLVLSKQHDIGVLKALGATPVDIRTIFLQVGVWVGLIGAGIGTFLGVIISLLINQLLQWLEKAAGVLSALLSGAPIDGSVIGGDFYLEVIPVQILAGPTMVIWLAAVLLAVISSLVPAYRASAVRPMQVFYRR